MNIRDYVKSSNAFKATTYCFAKYGDEKTTIEGIGKLFGFNKADNIKFKKTLILLNKLF